MANIIKKIILFCFNNNPKLGTFFISMFPFIEIRGAIPFGVNKGIWGNLALNNWDAYFYAFLGSSIIVPILTLIFLPILNFLKKTKLFKKIIIFIENYIHSKIKNEKSHYFLKILFVFIYVSLPLPLFGIWSGVLIALFLNLDYISICTTILLGNALAGLFETLLLFFFPKLNDYLLYIFLFLLLIFILIVILKLIFHKKKGVK